MEADTIDVSNNTVVMQNAALTGCKQCKKCRSHNFWEIKANEIHLQDNTINFRNAYMMLCGYKISPKLNFALNKKHWRRKNGFLPPEFYTTESSGITTRIPYYINIKPNLDAHIAPHISTQPKLELHFRHMPIPQIKYDITSLISRQNQQNKCMLHSSVKIKPHANIYFTGETRNSNDPLFFYENYKKHPVKNKYQILSYKDNLYINAGYKTISNLKNTAPYTNVTKYFRTSYKSEDKAISTIDKSWTHNWKYRDIVTTEIHKVSAAQFAREVQHSSGAVITSQNFIYHDKNSDNIKFTTQLRGALKKEYPLLTNKNGSIIVFTPEVSGVISSMQDNMQFDKVLTKHNQYTANWNDEMRYPTRSHMNLAARITSILKKDQAISASISSRIWAQRNQFLKAHYAANDSSTNCDADPQNSYSSQKIAPYKLSLSGHNSIGKIELNSWLQSNKLTHPVQHQIKGAISFNQLGLEIYHGYIDHRYYQYDQDATTHTNTQYTGAAATYNITDETSLLASTRIKNHKPPQISLGIEYNIECARLAIILTKKQNLSLNISFDIPIL